MPVLRAAFSALVGALLIASPAIPADPDADTIAARAAAPKTAVAPVAAPVDPEVPVALLVDLSTGQTLYAREAERRFMPASVTKVMTAYTGFKLIEEGSLNLDRRILYTKALEEEWYGEGSNMFLKAGERPTIGQLLLGITTVSANDAAIALALAHTGSVEKWLDLMNANAAELGMEDTHFGTPNGLPDGGMTYTSARDLIVLGEALTHRFPGLYKRYFGHRHLQWRDIAQVNHDPITGRVDGADGIKTGFTNEAGFTFLGSAERDGRRLMMVLAGAPTAAMRDKAARDLLEWGFREFSPRLAFAAGSEIGSAQVQNGARRAVTLQVAEDVFAAAPRTRDEALRMQLSYRGPLIAPIAAGEEVARLQIIVDGEKVHEVPVAAAHEVARANPLQRIGNALESWLN